MEFKKIAYFFILMWFAIAEVYCRSEFIQNDTIPDTTNSADIYCKLSKQLLNTDPEKSLAYSKKALENYISENNKQKKSNALYLIGISFKRLGNFDSALYYLNVCYKDRLLQKSELIQRAEALNAIGIIYSQRGVFSEGLAYFIRAQTIYEQCGDSASIAKGLNNIANIYYSLDQVDKAIIYYSKSIAIREKLHDESATNSGRIGLASICIEQKRFDEAEKYLNTALASAIKENDRPNTALIYTRLALLFSAKKDYEKTFACLKTSLKISEELNDEYGILTALSELGSFYYEAKDYKNAILYSKKALPYAEKLKSQSMLSDITETIAYAYKLQGDHKNAYDYFFDHLNYYTALWRKDHADKLTELQEKFEVSEKERKLKELSLEKVNRDIELYRKKNQVNYLIIAATLIIILLSLIYYRRILKQKNISIQKEKELHVQRLQAIEEKRLLQEKQQSELLNVIINVQEEERRKVGVDIHDGLGQLLSGIKMNLQLILNNEMIEGQAKKNLENILELNNESIAESKNIASNLLPYNIKDFGLVAAIKNLCYKNNQLQISNITFYSTDVPRKLPSELEITLYRITQELVNNALKHAKASDIFVQLFYRENKLILQIEDNGIGFNPEEAHRKANSMGLKNIAIRVKLLSGHFEIDSVKDKGTTILVEFPLI